MARLQVSVETGGYTFNVANKTITLGGLLVNIDLEDVIEVYNYTRSKKMFDYRDMFTSSASSNIASVSNNVITFVVVDQTWSNADRLKIIIEYPDKLIPQRVNDIQVGGHAEVIQNTITTNNTSAYTAGMNIGGINLLSACLRYNDSVVDLEDVAIWCKNGTPINCTIDYWMESPVAGTFTDHSQQVITGNHGLWLGSVQFFTSDFVITGSGSNMVARATKTTNIKLGTFAGSQDVYFTIVTHTGTTFVVTDGIEMKHGVKKH